MNVKKLTVTKKTSKMIKMKMKPLQHIID